jgi:hypothetical protein
VGRSRHAKELFGGAYQRDQVLVLELMKRDDLTTADFQDLLLRGAGNEPALSGALPEMIRGAIEWHRIGKYFRRSWHISIIV